MKDSETGTCCQENVEHGLSVPPDPTPCVGDGGPWDERSESLPCLYSNICTEEGSQEHRKEQILALCGILSPYHKRQAHTLFANVARLIEMAPSVGHVGFFTLTTKDVTDKDEFSRRWHSMRTHYWGTSPHFGHWLGCFEQQKRGAWHLHLLVILPYDIREGVNFAEFEQGRYKTASPYLRAVWRDLRAACVRYSFGRHELIPVKTNAEAMARYVGKYISKHVGQRDETAKGKRLVTSSQGWPKNSVHFAWNTPGAKEWRRKVALFASYCGLMTMQGLYNNLGPNWAYRYMDLIWRIDEEIQKTDRPVVAIKDGNLIDAKTGETLF